GRWFDRCGPDRGGMRVGLRATRHTAEGASQPLLLHWDLTAAMLHGPEIPGEFNSDSQRC
ncbi:hypothetical protein IXO599_03515, partial [Xanthomonas oryzae pv. oryzae]